VKDERKTKKELIAELEMLRGGLRRLIRQSNSLELIGTGL